MNGQGSSISWDLGSSWYSLSCLSVGDFLVQPGSPGRPPSRAC
ncbi:hypothetical protein FOC1_g10012731 [Fusarium oxysporum f. sp. cubense race 1]|uniref:Uncharacterized protein n=1 Tax=Fusarium oxysporum f. sp. cubense (strain race 1) TaxID=1229664 RepID=N4TIR6_FUSC1|nr:hypothetical protein FOC1_g10012731 [Fusarium oxysporum f. sp. cubense race 1]